MKPWSSDNQAIISPLADETEHLRGQWVNWLISADAARRKLSEAGPNSWWTQLLSLELGDAQSSGDNARIRYEIALAKLVDACRYLAEEESPAGVPPDGG